MKTGFKILKTLIERLAMIPKHKVGIGMRREAPSSWVAHNKAVHRSHPRDHSTCWGLWGQFVLGIAGRRVMASATICKQRNYSLSVGTEGAQSFGLGSFPSCSSIIIQPKLIPKLDSAAPRGTLINN